MDLSVIIPTFNRCRVLTRTLEALAREASTAYSFEVLVVDDGSSDDTARCLRELIATYPVPFTYFYQPNQKQGAARNLASRHARGTRLLFLGDDTVPQPGLLGRHQDAARRREHLEGVPNDHLVVLGYTTWPAEYRISRFLRYIGEQGWQFGFSLIEDPQNVPFNFFYTSNLSVNRRFFLEAGGFDEAFREYGWEDIELSWRLKEAGMRMVFEPRAITHHYHPTSFRSFKARQYRVGHSAWSFYRIHPEVADFLNIHRLPRYGVLRRAQLELLGWACQLTEHSRRIDLSHYYPDLMTFYYSLGLREAERRFRRLGYRKDSSLHPGAPKTTHLTET